MKAEKIDKRFDENKDISRNLDKSKARRNVQDRMKLNRKKTYLGRISKSDNGFVMASPAERLSMIWEITAEVWSLKKSPYVKRRLQRNVTNLIKK